MELEFYQHPLPSDEAGNSLSLTELQTEAEFDDIADDGDEL